MTKRHTDAARPNRPPLDAGRRLRVLVIAESCNPEWESIPLEGWSWYAAMSELVDTHLVTRNRNIPALTRAGLQEGRDFTALNTDALFDPMQALVRAISGPNKGWAMLTGLTIPSYLLLEHMMWRQFKPRLQAGEFDLVHRVTPLSPAVPSIIGRGLRRLGIPFVIGPINGGLPWPKQFPDLQQREGEYLSKLRGAYRLLPGYRSTRNAAAAIIVGGRHVLADLPQRWHSKTVYLPENGIWPDRFPRPEPHPAESYRDRTLRAVFLGRLVPYKGCDMLLQGAAGLLRSGAMTLEIIGFGPEQERLEQMTRDLGLQASVTFAGKVLHHELAAHLAQADIMTFPSLHEFGGAVVMEAMAAGVVPVVVDYGGPAELISDASGYLLPLSDRAGVIASLRSTLEAIAADPGQLAEKSRRAVERAFALFSWQAKARQMLAVYRWAAKLSAVKPDFGIPLTDLPEADQAA
jgi:glycosyltransferase involved in cell wall biosynthesis